VSFELQKCVPRLTVHLEAIVALWFRTIRFNRMVERTTRTGYYSHLSAGRDRYGWSQNSHLFSETKKKAPTARIGRIEDAGVKFRPSPLVCFLVSLKSKAMSWNCQLQQAIHRLSRNEQERESWLEISLSINVNLSSYAWSYAVLKTSLLAFKKTFFHCLFYVYGTATFAWTFSVQSSHLICKFC